MTEQEYQLIAGLFDNLRRMNGQPKDGQADAAIRQQAAQTPDAAYWLAQRSLLLEQSLQQAQAQIAQLQAQLQNQATAPSANSSGGFLSSGLDTHFGRAPQAAAPDYGQPAAGAYAGVPAGTPAATTATSAPAGWRDRWFGGARTAAPAPAPVPAAASAGGGFLGQAAASAAGVAGGMLLFNGLSHMLGNPAHAATSNSDSNTAEHSNKLADNTDNSGLDKLSQEAGRDHVGNSPAPNALLDEHASNSDDGGDYSDDGGFFDDDNFG